MNQETRKRPQFADHFRDFVEEKLKESFDNLNDITRSKYMARFFAERVLAPRNPLLPMIEEDIQACVVDAKGDQGVDFICRENGVVLIIQAKYSGGGRKAAKRRPEDPAHFEHFRTVLERLRNFRLLEMYEPLRELCAEIVWDKDRFQLFYITLRQLATNQEKIVEWNVASMSDLPDLLDRTELHLFDDTKLNLELRDTLSLDKSEPWMAELMATENADSRPWLRLGMNGGRNCYVGRISGAQLAILYTQHKSSLFTLNIRNYIGDTATNKAIKKTAIENPEEFFFFNNGISALAESIEPDEADPRILKCRNLSIVNGAQTVRSLHKMQDQNARAAKEVQVLIRLTETQSKKTTDEQEFLDSVTKFNNTQNAIRISDFRSNDKIQHDIRARFNALPSLNGKKFSYKNKRSGPTERDAKRGGDINVGMEEFTKTLYAFLYGPDDVFGGTGYVFDATADGGYAKLFGNGVEVDPSLGKERFERYAGIWFVCSQARDIWREESRKTKHSSLERRWMFYFALGRVLSRAYETLEAQYHADLGRLSSPSWMGEGFEGKVQKVIQRASVMAFQALRQAYEENSKTGAGHRNWFRSPATLEAITARVNESWRLVDEHADDYRFRGKSRSS